MANSRAPPLFYSQSGRNALAPAFDALTRPFLRPLRRLLPPVGNVDLTPLVLLVVLYVLLIVVNHLRTAAATL